MISFFNKILRLKNLLHLSFMIKKGLLKKSKNLKIFGH